MARSQRSGKLETRTARLKLPQGKIEFLTIGKGLSLGYRRTEGEYGIWQARTWVGSRYHYRSIGRADDFQDADGDGVLDFYQAQGVARTIYEEALRGGAPTKKDVTVQQATDRYLAWFREHRKGVKMAESAVRAHIIPTLGERRLADLTTADLRTWVDRLATKAARLRSSKLSKKLNLRPVAESKDEKRARRSSANRILSVLKAILNRAFQDGLVSDDSAWRKVKPFPKVDEARIRYLSDAEASRLVNTCPLDLRQLVRAALLDTDRRVGEGKPVAPSFLLACVLWADVREGWARYLDGQDRPAPFPALQDAIDEVFQGRIGDVSGGGKLAGDMREIWMMQPRFEKRTGSTPFGLVEQPRFRAAFDFMRLRAETGEVEEVLSDWWQEFSVADDNLRRDMVDGVRLEQTQKPRVQRAPRPAPAPRREGEGMPARPAQDGAPADDKADDGDNREFPADGEAPRKRRRRRRPGGARPQGDQGGAPSGGPGDAN